MTGASAAAIQKHYDLSNSFYKLWLDPTMSYSCALWDDTQDLETAQIKKLDYHITQSKAPGQSVILDIGCGWGAMLKRSVDHHNVKRAVGLTLSKAQHEYTSQVLSSQCEVRLESWSDHVSSEQYDSIISVGAFEHFARIEYSESEKVNCYRKFFEKCHSLIKPDGQLSLQTFAYGSLRSRAATMTSKGTQFLASEIFEETDPPQLSNIVEAVQGLFEIVLLKNDRLHYAKTCKVWMKNLKANQTNAIALVGEDKFEKYVRYLSLSYLGFQVGHLDLYRITLKPFSQKG